VKRARGIPLANLGVALTLLAALATTTASAASNYDIEVVVFEYVVPDSSGEAWPPDPGIPSLEGARGYPAAQRALGGAVARLRQSADYRVLAHRAWRQPGTSRGSSSPVLIQSSDGYNLVGTITVWRQRFLHAQLDLLLRPTSGATPVRVRQRRRMRSEELHYIDHPKLGVLIYATPAGAS